MSVRRVAKERRQIDSGTYENHLGEAFLTPMAKSSYGAGFPHANGKSILRSTRNDLCKDKGEKSRGRRTRSDA